MEAPWRERLATLTRAIAGSAGYDAATLDDLGLILGAAAGLLEAARFDYDPNVAEARFLTESEYAVELEEVGRGLSKGDPRGLEGSERGRRWLAGLHLNSAVLRIDAVRGRRSKGALLKIRHADINALAVWLKHASASRPPLFDLDVAVDGLEDVWADIKARPNLDRKGLRGRRPADLVVRIFLREVDRQVRFATLAYGDLQDNIRGTRPDVERIWYSIQTFLGAAANVSKVLWPAPSYDARGAHLRELLEVGDDSLLAPPRTVRNDFEHYDERIERWGEALARGEHDGTYVDSNFGPLTQEAALIGLDMPHRVMRNFEQGTWTVAFQGDSLDVRRVQRELLDIGARAAVALEALENATRE